MSDAAQIGPVPRVYGVAVRHQHVLLVRAAKAHDGGELWWLPGGGIDFGETPELALEREFAEETGLRLVDRELLLVSDDRRHRPNGEEVHSVRLIYVVSVADGELRHEHEGTTNQATWVPLGELGDFRLAPYAQHAITEAFKMLRDQHASDDERRARLAALRALSGFSGDAAG